MPGQDEQLTLPVPDEENLNTLNLLSRAMADFQRLYSGSKPSDNPLLWESYVRDAGLPEEVLAARQPATMKKMPGDLAAAEAAEKMLTAGIQGLAAKMAAKVVPLKPQFSTGVPKGQESEDAKSLFNLPKHAPGE